MSKRSTAFPVRQVSSINDLVNFTKRRKWNLRICKSEGNISTNKSGTCISNDVLQREAREPSESHICVKDEKIQTVWVNIFCFIMIKVLEETNFQNMFGQCEKHGNA